ncbi:hypothetical protein LSH36_160g03020 [Paralvinella palmiformis]|uniref:Kringle domain-containing protein n=1 Tax=Paralvinella palmiformis TaxID=53620 RepID=A0AAD9JTC0_9ANNE|nr:hypothetical protein LSH36_160g03020 [Paralvinella palmiformis]
MCCCLRSIVFYFVVVLFILGDVTADDNCKSGFFGWKCRFRCNCKDGQSCDQSSGDCPTGCHDNSWGPGCILNNKCAYNDIRYENYVGTLTKTEYGHTCAVWTLQKSYPGDQFPDDSLEDANNYCRNPKPLTYKTWCYYSEDNRTDWDYCNIQKCSCPLGRFGNNCRHECHCRDANEACNQTTGFCQSGCNRQWNGTFCQDGPYDKSELYDNAKNKTSHDTSSDTSINVNWVNPILISLPEVPDVSG